MGGLLGTVSGTWGAHRVLTTKKLECTACSSQVALDYQEDNQSGTTLGCNHDNRSTEVEGTAVCGSRRPYEDNDSPCQDYLQRGFSHLRIKDYRVGAENVRTVRFQKGDPWVYNEYVRGYFRVGASGRWWWGRIVKVHSDKQVEVRWTDNSTTYWAKDAYRFTTPFCNTCKADVKWYKTAWLDEN